MRTVKDIFDEAVRAPLNDGDDFQTITEMIGLHKASKKNSDVTDAELIDLIHDLIHREG